MSEPPDDGAYWLVGTAFIIFVLLAIWLFS